MSPKTGANHDRLKWCDPRCEFSDFAKVEALDGSCHTFQSLWCGKLEQHVAKNAPCAAVFGNRRPTG